MSWLEQIWSVPSPSCSLRVCGRAVVANYPLSFHPHRSPSLISVSSSSSKALHSFVPISYSWCSFPLRSRTICDAHNGSWPRSHLRLKRQGNSEEERSACVGEGGRWHKRASVSDPVTPQMPHKRFGWSVEISAQFGRTRLLLYSKQFHGHARTMYLVPVALYEYAWLLERKPPNALSPINFKGRLMVAVFFSNKQRHINHILWTQGQDKYWTGFCRRRYRDRVLSSTREQNWASVLIKSCNDTQERIRWDDTIDEIGKKRL